MQLRLDAWGCRMPMALCQKGLLWSPCALRGYTGEAGSSEILHLMSSGKDLSLRAKPHTSWASEEPGRQTLELIFLVKGLQHAGRDIHLVLDVPQNSRDR